MMTTVHSYTNDQRILDVAAQRPAPRPRRRPEHHPDHHRRRPALALVIPELKGKFDGFSLRVPTPTVSVVDFVAMVDKPATVDEVNAPSSGRRGHMKGILDYTDEPLVSSDFRGDSHSSIVDGLSTMVLGDNMIKVIAWYDNEWGYLRAASPT